MPLAMQHTPFWLFNLTYLLYLSPVIFFLVQFHLGGEGRRDKEVLVLPWDRAPLEHVASAAVFLPFMGVLYAAQRRGLAWLGWKQGEKLPRQHKDDFVRMTYINVSLLLLARVGGRLAAASGGSSGNSGDGLYQTLLSQAGFLALLAYYTAFFAVLFEMVRFVNLQVSLDLLGNPKGLWILIVSIVVLLGVLHAHVAFAFACGRDFGLAYLAWVALVHLGHPAVNVFPKRLLKAMDGKPKEEQNGENGEATKLHIHHWYWSLFAAHFTIFDTPLSCVAQAIFLGVYVHGCACFGLEAIFEPEHHHGD